MTLLTLPVVLARRGGTMSLLGLVLLVIAGVFLLGALESARLNVVRTPWRSPEMLLAAAGLLSAGVLGFGIVWALMLRWLATCETSFAALLRFFVYTWPGRYVPGTVPYHVARVMLAERIGVSRSAMTASIAYEAVLQVSSAAALGVICAFFALDVFDSSAGLYVLTALPLAALPALLQPRFLIPLANRVLAGVRRDRLRPDALLSGSQTTWAFGAYVVVHGVNGIAFYCVVSSFGGTDVSPLLAVAAFSLAGAAGAAVPVLPSGIGVREGVIAGLMGAVMPPGEAVLAAAAARAVSVVADIVPFALIGSLSLGSAVVGEAVHRTRRIRAGGLASRTAKS